MLTVISVIDTFKARCEIRVIKSQRAWNRVQAMEHFLETSIAQLKQ